MQNKNMGPTLSLENIREMVHPELFDEGDSSIFSGEEHLFLPPCLEGCSVLVLGCKSGLEAYACSALVGPYGKVTGVDADEEDIKKAELYVDYHTKLFRYKQPNVKFISTPLSNLSPIPSNSVDVIVSVCSLNSQKEKTAIFKECSRILKEGGEIYFSDVLSNKRPARSVGNKANATIYKEDFRRLMKSAGFEDVRMISREDISETYLDSLASVITTRSPLASPRPSRATSRANSRSNSRANSRSRHSQNLFLEPSLDLKSMSAKPLGADTEDLRGSGELPRIDPSVLLTPPNSVLLTASKTTIPKISRSPDLRASTVQYLLVTVRAFKLSTLEDRREDYGQLATYLGTKSQSLHVPFYLDDDNIFYLGRGAHVDGNTAAILGQTRYKSFFDVTAKGHHEGLFEA